MDRRALKTKRDIKFAFVTLLTNKKLDDISIKELAETAEINRATFYKHYEDKHDLLAALETEIIETTKAIIHRSMPLTPNVPYQKQPAFQAILEIYRYIAKEKPLLRVLIGPNGNPNFIQHLQYLLEHLLEKHFEDFQQSPDATVSREYAIVYAAYAHLGVIRQWVLKDLADTPEEMTEMLISLLLNGPVHAAGFITRQMY